MSEIKTTIIGDIGEKAAAEYMKENGYKILATNYRCKMGEIDIIARKDEYVIFCEVKARKSVLYGTPGEFVDFKKQQRIIKTAYKYLMENNLDCAVRFDVCEIIHKAKKTGEIEILNINYIEGAFEA